MIEGMDSIVASVSGYHGSERSKLIKLIDLVGANYVGKMTKSTTHLVCWEFKGRKYQLAKKFGTIVLNHQWLEECIKQGKHIPEHPYTLQSGKEVGVIVLDLPDHIETPGLLTENRLLLNKPNTLDRLKDVIDLDSDETENDGWDVDWLLDENLFPKPGSSNTVSRRCKRKVDKYPFKEDWQAKANNRRSIHEHQIPIVPRFEERSDNGTTASMDEAGPSRRSRRLVRKNAERNHTETNIVDVDEHIRFLGNTDDLTSTSWLSNNSTDFRDEIGVYNTRTHEGSSDDNGRSNDGDANLLNGIVALGETSLNNQPCSEAENLNGQLKKDVVDHSIGSSTSAEVSCVICWTNSSSTRGVLPCGHRFCFSCIQGWADHMADRSLKPTCPLCKASFASITIIDETDPLEQKIYSQTIPNPKSTQDIFFVQEGGRSDNEVSLPSVCCIICQRQPPDEFLVYCQICQTTCVHDYCLDPPLFPWTCPTCRERRLSYRCVWSSSSIDVKVFKPFEQSFGLLPIKAPVYIPEETVLERISKMPLSFWS